MFLYVVAKNHFFQYAVLNIADKSPHHKFDIKKVEVKSGMNKGQSKYLVSLIVPPYVFKTRRRAKEVGDTHYFTCNYCANSDGNEAKATAIREEDSENGSPNFTLETWPLSAEAHSCVPPNYQHLIRSFRQLCYEAVTNDPTKKAVRTFKSMLTPRRFALIKKVYTMYGEL